MRCLDIVAKNKKHGGELAAIVRFRKGRDEPEIGNVDEGVVEGGEDAGNAKDELACEKTNRQLPRDSSTTKFPVHMA